MKRIVFDLDDTIAIPNRFYCDARMYSEAEPHRRVIEAMESLRDTGFYIIIHTARRMRTCDGDIYRVIEEVGELTKKWLDDHKVPYHELVFGKPYSTTWYVDDRAMGVPEFLEWMNDEE